MSHQLEDLRYHKGQRKRLVENLKQKGIINEDVLKAMEAVPRHWFFHPDFEEHAYKDKAFPIEEGQTISQPFTVAVQTQLLDLKPHHKVLEIGTGSGYQAAVLCAMGAEVYSVEFQEKLFGKPKDKMKKMGCSNFQLFLGDGSKGLPAYAPFDRILLTAGAPSISDVLWEQLKPKGNIVAPVGSIKTQKMMRIWKEENGTKIEENHGSFVFVSLVGEWGWKK